MQKLTFNTLRYCFITILMLGFLSPAAFSQSNEELEARRKRLKRFERRFPQYELPDPKPFMDGITADDLKILVDTLSSDTMAGRETGEPGQQMAADYIAAQFDELELPKMGGRRSHEQKIYLERTKWDNLSFSIKGTEYKHRKDFYVFHAYNKSLKEIRIKQLVFAGYGIEDENYSDYEGVDAQGKAVVIYAGEPTQEDGRSVFTGGVNRTNWSIDWRRKIKIAQEKGAVLVIIIDPRFEDSVKENRRKISTYGWRTVGSDSARHESATMNCLFINESVAAALFGKRMKKVNASLAAINSGQKGKPVKIKSDVKVSMEKSSVRMTGSNVIGYIEGTDPNLRKDYIFVTAHYDHLGVRKGAIYNGADDNASGTAGVIEIARAFAEAKEKGIGPKRSVVCMLVSGEEKGLLGSRFYTDFPIFSLKRTLVDINIDMIGRVDKAHEGNPDYVYVIGAGRISSTLDKIVKYMNEDYTKMELDYKYDDPDDPNHFYERSDHYNFAKNGIPVVFFFNGTHEDYHRATDTREKINYDALTKRTKLAFLVAWDVANSPYKLKPDEK